MLAEDLKSHLYVVILCEEADGSLWPLSRAQAPFDLLIPIPEGGVESATSRNDDDGNGAHRGSLLGDLAGSLRSYTNNPLYVFGNAKLERTIAEHLIGQGILSADDFVFIGETQPRSEALSLALAAAHIRLIDHRAVVLVVSTHQRFDTDEYWDSALARAYVAAEAGHVALIGVEPRGQASHRSAVIAGAEISGPDEPDGLFAVRSYHAHPSSTFCARMSAKGTYWVTDMICAQATTLINEMRAVAEAKASPHAPELGRTAETAQLIAALDNAQTTDWFRGEAATLVGSLPPLSLKEDFLTYARELVVAPASFAWEEFASFEEIAGNAADGDGNSLDARGTLMESTRTTVFSQSNRFITTLGLHDTLVVDTPDALLVADKGKLAAMPELIASLAAARVPELHSASVTARSWGRSTVLWHNETVTAEKVEVVPGAELPLETIGSSEETWTVAEGDLEMRYDGESRVLHVGDSVRIAPHRERYLRNNGDRTAVALVVSVERAELF